MCGHPFKYAESHSRDLGPEGVDLCSQTCAAKYWERSDDENDSAIRCPKCGGETIFVVQVACMEHAQYHTGHWPLNTDGFAWDESGTHRDGSTENEIAECGDCGYCCPAGALHEFGFGQQREDITCDSVLCSRSTCNGCPLDADDGDARPEDDEDNEAGDDVCDNCHTAGVPISQTCPECGRTLCANCAAEDDGLCGACAAERAETGTEGAEDIDDDAPPTSG
jgi:DNA-directed RNA polymerase subunit RPC12/RpoP